MYEPFIILNRMPRSSRRSTSQQNIPMKANRVLNIILLAMILIAIRIWHLGVVQHDQKLDESRKPQRRVIVEPAKRASIRDRFNIPLAVNKMQYQATILYSQFQQIPSISWQKDPSGKRIKVFKRKEYISQLAQLLGEELEMDPTRLEDLIYSKAAYYLHLPFVLKEDISEKAYYRLKMLEKDWLGIHVRMLPKRFYPQGRVASDIIGYMGAINRQEYETILHEIKALEEHLTQYEDGLEPELPVGMDSEEQVAKRLHVLRQKAYTINDYIGKTGIEGRYEEELRGFQGRKNYHSDARGNYLRELPGSREPLSGHRILLTISSELQEYAESLLAQNESIRHVRVSNRGQDKRTTLTDRHPWIKGGAIVAMDPNNGEVLALASYPRFNPNDFISSGDPDVQQEKQANICRWFENETYLADLWDQKCLLKREYWNPQSQTFYDEAQYLTWETYLKFILPPDNEVRIALHDIQRIDDAISLQRLAEALLKVTEQDNLYAVFNAIYSSDDHHPYPVSIPSEKKAILNDRLKEKEKEIESLKKALSPYITHVSHNYNKVLLIDLCRLAASREVFSKELLREVGGQKIPFYRNVTCTLVYLKSVVEKMTKTLYHGTSFKEWRQLNEKAFLKEKREQEKLQHKYATPYIDYLDNEEKAQFKLFWNTCQYPLLVAFLTGEIPENPPEILKPYLNYFLVWHNELKEGAHQAIEWRDKYLLLQQALKGLPSEIAVAYLKTMRGFKELDKPLFGCYKFLRNRSNVALEKHLAAAFYPVYGYGYGRSHAYRQSTVQGSIFKIIVAYEALIQNYIKLGQPTPSIAELNPLIITDQNYQQGRTSYVGYNNEGKPIPLMYNGGRLPRSQLSHIGSIDILKALETSSNPYFALLASEHIEDPQDLIEAAQQFSYGSRTGIDLPGEITGSIPRDVHENQTGLYAFAIGQHTFVVTPLQTAVMLAAIANGGKVLKPKIVSCTVGKSYPQNNENTFGAHLFSCQKGLSSIGIDIPPFTPNTDSEEKNVVNCIETEVLRHVFMPDVVKSILLKAMQRMVHRTQTDGLLGLKKLYAKQPEAMTAYLGLRNEIIGKSSTSEVVERIDLDKDHGVSIYTHVWFGGISFESPSNDISKTFVFHDNFDKPELVVVVYLRYGGFGKEAAPLAAQIVQKWRELKQAHAKNGS